jgi:PST family polysaccharide transporter
MSGGHTDANVRTLRALFWTLLDVGGSQGLSLLLYVIFTRILMPGEYGVFALALAITAMANTVLFQGFADALIQHEAPDEEDRSTAFWTNLALGAALTVLLVLSAPAFSVAVGNASLSPILQAMAMLCLLRALVSVHSALCRREMRMGIFALRAIGGYLIGGLCGIALAIAGWGVWALVACQMVQAVVILVVMWTTIRWTPRLRFSRRSLKRLAGFSSPFMIAAIFSATADKVDNLIIGVMLDVVAVGHYNLALKMMQALGFIAMSPLALLMMPVLSRLAHDHLAFRDEYVRLVTASLSIWLPLAIGLGFLAPAVVPTAFGPQWADAVPVLQAMALGGVTVPLWAFTGQALSALGRPTAYVWLAGGQLVLATIAYAAAAPFGIVSVSFAWAGVSALLVPIHLLVLERVLGKSFLPLVCSALRLAAAGAGMVAVMLTGHRLSNGNAWLTGMAGCVAYLVLLEMALIPRYVSGGIRFARVAIFAQGGIR